MIKLLLFLLFSSIAVAQRTVVLTWKSGNVGTAKLPTCSLSTPKRCVYGFTLKMDGIQIAGPAKLGVLATTYTQTTLPAKGTHTYSLVMNGYDVVGNALNSKPDITTIIVPAKTVIPTATSLRAVRK
jgi:hypothetical protein